MWIKKSISYIKKTYGTVKGVSSSRYLLNKNFFTLDFKMCLVRIDFISPGRSCFIVHGAQQILTDDKLKYIYAAYILNI